MRWKFVIPAAVIVGLITAFNIFFLDSILRNRMIAAGELIFGAKVEIASVKTSLGKLSIAIRGVAVGDKNEPMKNLFELKDVKFGVQPIPLLSKKFIIREMAVEGVAWGTSRTASAELPKATQIIVDRKQKAETKNSAAGRLMNSLAEKAKSEAAALPAVENFKDIQNTIQNFSAGNLVDSADIQSIKEMEAMRAGSAAEYDSYRNRIQALPVEEQVQRTIALTNEVSKLKIATPQDIDPARAKIEQLNAARQELEKTQREISTLQNQMQADLGQQGDVLKRINELKDRDIRNISGKLKLPSFAMGNLSQSIFGPAWINRVNRVVYYIAVARRYMPPRKKEEDKLIRPRLRGMDISFPGRSMPPDFLIQHVILSGTTGGAGKGSGTEFRGTVNNITSDPVRLGLPTTFELSGVQGGQSVQITGSLDHTREVPVDFFKAVYLGMPASNLGLPQSDYLPSFESGTAGIETAFTMTGDVLNAGITFTVNNLTSAPSSKLSADAAEIVGMLWSGVSSLGVTAVVSGTPDGLSISVSSTIDKLLADRVKSIYGEKMARIQNQIQSEVNRLTEEKKNEVLGQFNSSRAGAQGLAAEKQKEIADQINAAQSAVKAKENEMRSQVDREKNKAESELRNKAQEQLQKLFK